MGNKLIIITNYYPFFKGEEYIENEIEIASKYYERILIIPTMVSDKMRQTRVVPTNVSVLDIKINCSVIGKLMILLSGAYTTLFEKKDYKTIIKESEKNPKWLAYNLYFRSRVWYVYNKIVNDKCFMQFVSEGSAPVIYSYWMHVTASIAARLRKYYFDDNVIAVTRGHRYDLYDYAAPCKFIPDRKFVMSQMNMIFPCSYDGNQYLRVKYPIFSEKIAVQRLGTKDHKRIKCKKDKMFCLVSCAVIRPVKRLDKIIRLVKSLCDEGYNIRWFHLGQGPYLKKIESLAKKTLRAETFRFVGQLKNEEIFQWYSNNKVSCFINLSDSEGVPVSIMEAMCIGVPVIATNVGGSREMIDDGKNGFIVEKDDEISVIVDRVKRIINMTDNAYQTMCNNSRKSWETNCDANSLYNDFYLLLEDLYEKNSNCN